MFTRSSIEGASTIDQQFVRALHGDFRRALARKLKDAVLAIRVQNVIPKRHIAGSYLMVAYFGPALKGVIYTAKKLGIDLASCSDVDLARLIARIKYPASPLPTPSYEALLSMRSNWLLKMAKLPSAPPASRN
jgi:penicillin-binding protein 1A